MYTGLTLALRASSSLLGEQALVAGRTIARRWDALEVRYWQLRRAKSTWFR